jgi:HAE1 family hydrophobic/amphiphilic exporter-1
LRHISARAIRNPVPVMVLFLMLAFGGCLGFRALPVTLSPDTSFPVAVVTATEPGAAPMDLEQAVAIPIEDQVAAISGVNHVLSETASGIATVTVEFRIGENPDAAIEAVRAAVDAARMKLPADLPPPSVTQLETQGGPVLTYAAADTALSPLDLSRLVETEISSTLSRVPGVAQVSALGAQHAEIAVAADPARLAAFGLTLPALDQQLHAAVAAPQSGTAKLGSISAPVRMLATSGSVASLASFPVMTGSGQSVPLSTLASVREDAAPAVGLARLDGVPVMAFAIWQAPGADALVLSRQVRAALDGIEAVHPGLSFTRVSGTVDDTRSTYDSAIEALIEGLVLATATVWLFLGDVRGTLIAAVAMPLSLLPTFLVLALTGQSLNSITLLALALVVGILVDDAIVEIENIERHIGLGKRPYRAALDAADEIGPAVVATSCAIIAVFLPISMMQGVVGQYLKPFGLTVSVAVFTSLLVARLFTPVLAAYFLAPRGLVHRAPVWLPEYQRLLDRALAAPRFCLVLAAGVLVLTLATASLIPTGFLPVENEDDAHITVTLPPGSTIEAADAFAARITQILRAAPALREDVGSVFALSGVSGAGSASGPAGSDNIAITIHLRPGRPDTRAAFEAKLRPVLDGVPDLVWHMADTGDSQDLELDFTGGDPAALDAAMHRLAAAAATLPGLSHVQANGAVPATEMAVVPKAAMMANLGVSTAGIANTLLLATGTALPGAPEIVQDGRHIPLRLMLDGNANEAALDQLLVSAPGRPVPLPLVADIGERPGPGLLERADRQPMEGIGADLLPGTTLGQATAEVKLLPAYKILASEGIAGLDLGSTEMMNEMFSQFGFALGAGMVALLGVLLLLFRNVLQPLTIIATLPLCLSGALTALLASGLALDLSSAIGLLTLLGIVTKNAILIVDAALEGERLGLPRREAARAAGLRRARPVVMTTIAMVAGMLPVTFSTGAGASLRLPIAVAVIGGLVASTVLSLVLVPVFYVLIGDLAARMAPAFRKISTVSAEDLHASGGQS